MQQELVGDPDTSLGYQAHDKVLHARRPQLVCSFEMLWGWGRMRGHAAMAKPSIFLAAQIEAAQL